MSILKRFITIEKETQVFISDYFKSFKDLTLFILN